MFVRWQISEIRKIRDRDITALWSGIETRPLCGRCSCRKVMRWEVLDQETCDRLRSDHGVDATPGTAVLAPELTPKHSRCQYGQILADGRIIFERRLKAVLCESGRVNGRPRQTHVAYLGSIEESWLPSFFDGISAEEAAGLKVQDWDDLSAASRHGFWIGALKKLDRLDNRIPKAERKKIEAMLATRIPRPTKMEIVDLQDLARAINLRT